MYNYPNPCDTCTSCTDPSGCDKWRMRFRTIWKQFNSYQVRQYGKKETANDQSKYAYEHPDVIRKYITDGPCKDCQLEPQCDVPCNAYYQWWGVRMEVLRKKYGGGK